MKAIAAATTVSRRSLLTRLLVAAAVAPVMGTAPAGPVNAGKKKKRPSISARVQNVREMCELGGGTLAVSEGAGGTTTECKGGDDNGQVCFISKTKTRCAKTLTHSPATNAGGGGAIPPGDVGNEDPTGGTNAGGGAHVPPGGGVDSGGSSPILE
jgi:hypothetical protein